MSHRGCKDPCSRFITAGDTHDRCVVCLQNVQAVLSGLSTCSHCDGLRLKVLRSRVEIFSKVAPASNPHRVAFAVAKALHKVMAWGNVCNPDCEDSDVLELSRSLSPIECKRSAKTTWSPLFSPTRIYGPPRRPTVQSPSAAGCMMTTICPLQPRSWRTSWPTHADLSLLADRRDAAPHLTASCWM